MVEAQNLPSEAAARVREACLCLHAQRAARVLARRFDAVLRPAGLTNSQFSLLMGLNRPEPARFRDVALLLGADRTTLTAALKPLTREGLVEVSADPEDARARRVGLTPKGRARLAQALPLWTEAHARLERELDDPDHLRLGLKALARSEERTPS